MAKEILYTKYNSMRAPEYQMKTTILEEEGERYVLKSPMCEAAVPYVTEIEENYARMGKLYEHIRALPYEEQKRMTRRADGSWAEYTDLKFAYLNGRSISHDVDFDSRDIYKITEQLKAVFEVIFDYKYECLSVVDGEAYVCPANLDSILSNFIRVDDEVWCLDYEWMTDQPTPLRYIQFRSLLYLYSDRAVLRTLGSFPDFMGRFGYTQEDIDRYMAMEDAFQQRVHGEGRRYAYLPAYARQNTTLTELLQDREELEAAKAALADKDQQIQQLSDHLERFHRCMKDPGYALAFLMRKLRRKYYWIKNRDLVNAGPTAEDDKYEDWIVSKETKNARENDQMETREEIFLYQPLISVIIPVYNVEDSQLKACIESVIGQKYPNWELCLADDCSTMPGVRKVLAAYQADKRCAGRIHVTLREENGHISRCSNTAIATATGEFLAFLDCDDLLADNAFHEVVRALNENPDLDFIYSDEDKVDENGRHRRTPFFKPDWSPDLMMSMMYTCHLSVYRKTVADSIAMEKDGAALWLNPEYDGAQDYDFALRFTEAIPDTHIAHIPMILYHWRERAESTASSVGAKPYVMEATRKLKEAALKRRGLNGMVELIPDVYQYRVDYRSKTDPKVSIIIPSKDNYAVLLRCIETIRSKTVYPNYEIILVDNGSELVNRKRYESLAARYGITYHYEVMPFNFSHMCNIGAEEATGRLLLFLNDDTEVTDGSWLYRMAGQADLDHAGAVGAKLLYPGGRLIQHTGVLNIKNGPSHALARYSDETVYYFNRNRIDYNYLAVTAACLMVDSHKFRKVGGFNEELAVAYNDIDLCMRLTEAGYYNVVRNDVVLIHHESISRGSDTDNPEKFRRLQRELRRLYDMHPAYDGRDPFYNPNLISSDVNFRCDIENEKLKYDTLTELDAAAREKVSARTAEGAVGQQGVAGRTGIIYKIERLSFGENIEVDGYIYLRGDKRNNEAEVKVLFAGENRTYLVGTRRLYRPDVETADPENLCMFTGFICRFGHDKAEHGNYRIGLVRNGVLVMTETTMEI